MSCDEPVPVPHTHVSPVTMQFRGPALKTDNGVYNALVRMIRDTVTGERDSFQWFQSAAARGNIVMRSEILIKGQGAA